MPKAQPNSLNGRSGMFTEVTYSACGVVLDTKTPVRYIEH